MLIHYESIEALRTAYIKVCGEGTAYSKGWSGQGLEWYGNETEAQSLRFAHEGNTRLVPEAEALIHNLDTMIETTRRVWQPSPAGAFPVVADYLRGLPTSMRRMLHERDESAPITILVNTSCSAGIDADTIERRGAVILALVLALSRIRPVTLKAVAFMHGRADGETILSATINTNPLDLATACYVLTSAGYARRLTYNIARAVNSFNGSWPKDFDYYHPALYYTYLKTLLSPDPARTLVVGAAQLGDDLLSDPVAWITNQIQRFTTDQEQEALP